MDPPPRADSMGPRKRGIGSWVVIALILIAAGVAAGVVAMSGPDVTPKHAPAPAPAPKAN
jgi:hypothetical protein